jgi:hippurate hydrolase
MAALFRKEIGADRVVKTPAVMGGEDFSRFYRADKSIGAFIFWVGGVPAASLKSPPATGLPSLHSPFWAPDAEKVIRTASEALTIAALDILKKG